jgi:hypothetical protein
MTGSRGGHNPDSDELARYVSGKPSGRLVVEEHRNLQREYNNFMVIQHDDNMFVNRQPRNQCLLRLIRLQAARWIGDYVAHAYKYRYSDDPNAYHVDDQGLVEDDFPLIALDLDTTSLGPLVPFLRWRAQNKGNAMAF